MKAPRWLAALLLLASAEARAAGFTEQAAIGAGLYAERCAACHGARLEGGGAIELTGINTAYRWIGQTAQDLHDRVVTMPKGAPRSLSESDYLALTAFLVEVNGGKPGHALDAATLRQVPIGIVEAKLVQPRTVTRRDISAALAGHPTQAELDRTTPDAWLLPSLDYGARRHVELDQINRGNVGRLKPACLFQAGDTQPFASNPLVYDGQLFFTTRTAAFSIDAATCRLNWRYDRPFRVPLGFGLKMSRGAVLKDGLLVFGTNDGFLVALDAGTGQQRWQRDLVDPKQNQGGFTMPPLVYDDMVIIGPSGSELGARGWLGAFRLQTGEPVWRFKTIPDEGEPGAETWPSQAARELGGGTVWGTMTLDAARGLLYAPVSNPGPAFDGTNRNGANLYTSSMVAIELKSGKLAWHVQVSPHDTHDYDVTHAGPLFRARVDGKPRDVAIVAGKEGLMQAFDADTHQRLYEVAVVDRANTDQPWFGVDKTASGAKVCPGAYGGMEWAGPAFDAKTNLLYVPTVQWCGTTSLPFDQARGEVVAADAATGRVRWRYRSERPVLAAVTSTSGGLVFTGELTGDFLALDSSTGKVLLRYHLGGPMLGGVVTYRAGGAQYVAVASGSASSLWPVDPAGAAIAVFALP